MPRSTKTRCTNCWSRSHRTISCSSPPLPIIEREKLRLRLSIALPHDPSYSDILAGKLDNICFNCWSTTHRIMQCDKTRINTMEREGLRFKLGVPVTEGWRREMMKEGGECIRYEEVKVKDGEGGKGEEERGIGLLVEKKLAGEKKVEGVGNVEGGISLKKKPDGAVEGSKQGASKGEAKQNLPPVKEQKPQKNNTTAKEISKGKQVNSKGRSRLQSFVALPLTPVTKPSTRPPSRSIDCGSEGYEESIFSGSYTPSVSYSQAAKGAEMHNKASNIGRVIGNMDKEFSPLEGSTIPQPLDHHLQQTNLPQPLEESTPPSDGESEPDIRIILGPFSPTSSTSENMPSNINLPNLNSIAQTRAQMAANVTTVLNQVTTMQSSALRHLSDINLQMIRDRDEHDDRDTAAKHRQDRTDINLQQHRAEFNDFKGYVSDRFVQIESDIQQSNDLAAQNNMATQQVIATQKLILENQQRLLAAISGMSPAQRPQAVVHADEEDDLFERAMAEINGRISRLRSPGGGSY